MNGLGWGFFTSLLYFDTNCVELENAIFLLL